MHSLLSDYLTAGIVPSIQNHSQIHYNCCATTEIIAMQYDWINITYGNPFWLPVVFDGGPVAIKWPEEFPNAITDT